MFDIYLFSAVPIPKMWAGRLWIDANSVYAMQIYKRVVW